MRISKNLLLTCAVLFASALSAFAVPTVTISNLRHACGGNANGSFQINVTAATGAQLKVRVFGPPGFTDIDQTFNPIPALPFTFPVPNLPGSNTDPSGAEYIVIVSDGTGNKTEFVYVYDFTVSLTSVTQNTNPGCATPNGAIDVSLVGSSPAGAITYQWTGPGGPYTTQDLSGLGGGDYNLSYSDGFTTCTLGPVHIDDPAPTPFTLSSPDSDICAGDVLTVSISTADNGYTYTVLEGVTVLGSAPGAGGPLNINVPGLSTGNHTLRVRASAGVCAPRFNDPADLAVTVNPTPDYNNYNNDSAPGGICSSTAIGLDLLTLKKAASVAATDYNITNIASAGLTATAGSPGTGNTLPATVIADDVWQNLTSGPLNVVYTIVPVTNSCPGPAFTVTVTIKPQPDYNNYNNDLVPGGVCSKSAIGVTLDPLKKASSILATSYNITAISSTNLTATGGSPSTGVGLASNVIADDQWQNTTNSTQNVQYTIVPVAAGCTGAPFTVTVTINPQPDYNNYNNDNVPGGICSETALAIDLSALQKGTSVAATTFNITNIASAGLTAIAGTPATGNGLAANVIADDQWRNVTNANIDVVYTIAPVIGSCVGNPFTVTVTIKPQPDYNNYANNNAPGGICSDDAIGLDLLTLKKVTSVAATSYNIISIASAGLTATAGSPAVATGVTATEISDDKWENKSSGSLDVVYTIAPVAGTCVGAQFTVTVTINPEPDFNNYADDNAPGGICSGDAIGLNLSILKKASSVAATSYNITAISSAGLTIGAGAPAVANGVTAANLADDAWINTTNAALTVTYTIVPLAGTCAGNPFTVLVTINPRPDYNNYNNNLAPGGVCATALGIDLASLKKPASIAATTYNITGITSAGLTAVAGSPAAGTGLAANEIADDVWSNTTNGNLDVVYTVVPVTGTCAGAPFTVTVTIRPQPDYNNYANNNAPGGICSEDAIGLDLLTLKKATSVAATSYNIISIASAGLTATAGSPAVATGVTAAAISDDKWENKSSGSLDVVYTIEPVAGTCVGAQFTVTVTINPEPDFNNYADDNAPGGICSGDALGLNLSILKKASSVAATSYNITAISSAGLTIGAGAPAVANGVTAANLADDAWINTTNAALTVTYTIVPLAGTCAGNPFTVVVTINPQPDYNNYNNDLAPGGVCATALGIDLASLKKLSSVAATTYNITGITSTGLTAVAGTPATGTGLAANEIADDVWSNITNGNLDVVYTVVPVTGTCAGAPFTVTVTVRPQPDYNDFSGAQCSDAALSFNMDALKAPTSVLATQYNITSIAPAAGLTNTSTTPEVLGIAPDAIIGDSWQNLTAGPLDVVYTIVPTAGTCAGASFTITATIRPEPVYANYNNDASPTGICSGDAIALDLESLKNASSVSASTFSFTTASVPAGLVPVAGTPLADTGNSLILADDQWTNTTNAPIDIVYTISPTSAVGCVGSNFTVTVTINPQPDYNNYNNDNAPTGTCSNSAIAVDLSVLKKTTSVAATTYNITGITFGGLTAAGGTPAIANGVSALEISDDVWQNITSSSHDVVYTVVPVIGTCEGAPFTVTVTVLPQPDFNNYNNNAAPGGICSEASLNVDLSTLKKVTSVAATSFNITNIVSTGLTATAGAPSTGNGLGANVIADDQWQNVSGAPLNVTYTIVPVSGACAGSSFDVVVTINPEPFSADITRAICSNSSTFVDLQTDAIDAEGNALPGTTFSWIGTANSNVTGVTTTTQTTADISDVLVNTNTVVETVVYTVTPTSSLGCVGASFTVSVDVSPQAVITAGQSTDICSGSPVGYEILLTPANLPAGTTFSWPDPDGAGPATAGVNVPMGTAGTIHINDVLTNTNAAPLVVTYVVTPSVLGFCNGTPENIVVRVNRAAIADAGADVAICTGGGAYTLAGTSVGGAASNGTWSFSSQPAGGDGVISPLTALTNPSTATFTATVTGDYVLALTTDDPTGVCGPAVDLVTITVTPIPVIAPGQSKLMCGNDPVAYEILMTPANLPANTVFNWPDPDGSGPATAGVNVALGTPGTLHINDLLINNTSSNITVTYVVTPSVGLCAGTPQNVVVTVRPSPVVALGQTKTICSGDFVNYEILLSPANSPAGTTFSWPDPDGAGPATSRSNVPADPAGTFHITDQLFNGTGAPIHVVYSVISKGTNGCTGVTRDIDIIVNSGAIAEAGNAQSICAGGTTTLTGSSIGGLATNGTWTVVSSPTGGDGTLTNGVATATPAAATFKATVPGDYTLQLATDDPAGSCPPVTDVVVITVKSPADPSCTGGTGTCATVVITPIPTPATCNNSDGGILFDIVPALPIINNTGVRIDIVGTGPTNLTISRTNFNDYDFAGLPTGVYNYTIEYGDPSCIKTGTVTIDRSGTIGTPVATNLVDPVCFGPPFGTATIDAPGETGNQLEWSVDGLTWTPFIAGQPVVGIPGGTNVVSVRRNSGDPCASGVVITLANPAQIAANFAAVDATCSNNDGTITVSGLTGGTAPYSFTLNGTAVNLPPSNVLTGLTANTYTIAITDSKGCSKTFNPVTVSFPGFVGHTAPVISAPDCTGGGNNGKVEFSITDPGSFQFAITTDLVVEPAASQFNTLGGTLVSISNLANNNYAIWLKPLGAGTKCSTKVPVTITGIYSVSYTATTSDVVCFGQPSSIVVNNLAGAPGLPYVYRLTNTGDNSVSTGSITASQALGAYSITGVAPGRYSLVVTQDQSTLVPSCTTPISGGARALTVLGPTASLDSLYVKRTISFPDLPSASAVVGVKPSGREPYEVRLELTSPLFGAQQFVSDWTEVQVNPQNLKFEKTYTNLYSGGYTMGIRDAGGCEKTYSFTIGVDTQLFIPNIFTPNGDGSNEVFYIRNLPSEAKLLITNRWGKEVYKSSAYQNDWNGGDAVDGVYYYTINLAGQSYTGWVEILRGN